MNLGLSKECNTVVDKECKEVVETKCQVSYLLCQVNSMHSCTTT